MYRNSRNRTSHRMLNRLMLVLTSVLVVMVLIYFADKEQFITLPESFAGLIKFLLAAAIFYSAATFFVRLTINRVMGLFDANVPIEHKLLLSKSYIILTYAVATMFVFREIGVTVENIALFIGLVTTGIAFAIREVILSYLIWFMLLTKRPFKIGDYIRIGDDEGVVRHIGTFYVLVDDSPDVYEDFMRIPNKLFIEKPIQNFGRGKYQSKVIVSLKKIHPGFEKCLERLRSDIDKATGEKARIYLDAEKEYVRLKIYYLAEISEKDAIRDSIMRLVIKNIGKSL